MSKETGIKNKIISAFGLNDLDEEYDDYIDDDGYYVSESEQTETESSPAQAHYTPSAAPTNVTTNDGSPDVLVLDPTDFEEAPGIVNKLKQNKTIVVNLKETDYEEGKKIFDFLSGAVFALEGSLNRIAESVFILAPQMVHVSTKMDEAPGSSYRSSVANWETD